MIWCLFTLSDYQLIRGGYRSAVMALRVSEKPSEQFHLQYSYEGKGQLNTGAEKRGHGILSDIKNTERNAIIINRKTSKYIEHNKIRFEQETPAKKSLEQVRASQAKYLNFSSSSTATHRPKLWKIARAAGVGFRSSAAPSCCAMEGYLTKHVGTAWRLPLPHIAMHRIVAWRPHLVLFQPSWSDLFP